MYFIYSFVLNLLVIFLSYLSNSHQFFLRYQIVISFFFVIK